MANRDTSQAVGNTSPLGTRAAANSLDRQRACQVLALSGIARYLTCFRYAFNSGRSSDANGQTKSSARTPRQSVEQQRA
jgi:hypothetical protein